MARRNAKALAKELALWEADDERLAARMQALHARLAELLNDIEERRKLGHQDVDQRADGQVAELSAIRADITGIVTHIKSEPTVIEGGRGKLAHG